MAIDTAQKRAGAASVGKVWRGRSIRPDGTIGQADRQQVGWGYPGILAIAPAPLAVCTADVYVSITPTGIVLISLSPTANVLANISPTGEVLIDELG